MKPWYRNGTLLNDSMKGRTSCVAEEPESSLILEEVKLDGDYDKGGAYWGCGHTLWCLWGKEGTEVYFRASDFHTALIEGMSLANQLAWDEGRVLALPPTIKIKTGRKARRKK